jgi:hypothetical protein
MGNKWEGGITITNFLDFCLSLALRAYPKSLRRCFIADPEVHLQYFREERWYDINRGKWEISGRGGSIDRNRDRDRDLSSRKYWRIDATITNFLDFCLSLALRAYPKSLRKKADLQKENSMWPGFSDSQKDKKPMSSLPIRCTFLVSILGHTSTKIIINKGCSLLFLSRDLNVSVYSGHG